MVNLWHAARATPRSGVLPAPLLPGGPVACLSGPIRRRKSSSSIHACCTHETLPQPAREILGERGDESKFRFCDRKCAKPAFQNAIARSHWVYNSDEHIFQKPEQSKSRFGFEPA